MKCVILQPSYIPWRGFFHQVQKADVFVFYDDVQYDVRGWRNRNRIKTAQGPKWLTVPVLASGAQTEHRLIKDIEICWDREWAAKHEATILQAYRSAPYFAEYAPLVRQLYRGRSRLLADFTIEATLLLAEALGIRHTRFLRASTLGVRGAKTERLLAVLQKLEATHYISGPSARAYLDETLLALNGISVEYMRYEYPEYPQLFPPFDPQVSIIDLLFMCGPSAPQVIWSQVDSGRRT